MEKIIIENGLARVVNEETVFECKAEDMVERFLTRLPIRTKFIPKNTIYYERGENQSSVFVVELCPRISRIKWRGPDGPDDRDDGEVKFYRVSMPFVYFTFSVRETEGVVRAVFPFCSKEPVRDVKAKIHIAPISNIHGGGNEAMCLGSIRANNAWPIHQKIDYIIDQIFSTEWNNEIGYVLPSKIGTFKKWSDETIKDPLVWMKVEYGEHRRKTLGSIVEYAINMRDS